MMQFFPAKLLMICWIVALCVAVVGCSDDEDDGSDISPPDRTSEALTLPSDHGLAAGSVTVQPGASDEHGDVVVSCPAGGSACVVNVAANGSATYDRTGGMPTVSPVVAEFPRHPIGTSWSFVVDDSELDDDYTFNMRITGRREHRGRGVLVIVINSVLTTETDLQLWDAETGNEVASLDEETDDEGVAEEYDPHSGMLSFPMKVGNTWRAIYTYRETSTIFNEEETYEQKEWQDWKVVAWEEVTVPAGTFMAFRVTLTGASYSGPYDFTYWYAPEIGFFVKLDTGDDGAITELTDLL